MEAYLMALGDTELSQWIIGDTWVFSGLLALHSIGLGLLVGLLMIIDLRILGVAGALPLQPLAKLMPAVWFGFVLNAFSGLVLFFAQPVKIYHNTSFWMKMACVVAGVLIGLYLNRTILRRPGGNAIGLTPRLLAVLSLASWTAAAIAGRLIAYT